MSSRVNRETDVVRTSDLSSDLSPADLRPADLRSVRKADTEQRIIDAAARLFVEEGYAATTLTAVARAAAVGDRTVYVRFGTKAALLKRTIDVAIVGDAEPVDLMGREWHHVATHAPTLAERIDAFASASAALQARAGPLIAVAREAEPKEPLIAAAAQAGREATLDAIRGFWESLRDDNLMSPDVDLEWVVATSSLLAHAETYQLMTRTLRWDVETYERWLYRTWMHLATTPGPASTA